MASLGAYKTSLGMDNNLVAKSMAILRAFELAVNKGWERLWGQSDSMTVCQEFDNNKVCWGNQIKMD